LGDGVRSYHLRQSLTRTIGGVVREPRHFLIYRLDADGVVIGRVLHESMDLERHIDPASTWAP
jgi:toxin ParE1/3/4